MKLYRMLWVTKHWRLSAQLHQLAGFYIWIYFVNWKDQPNNEVRPWFYQGPSNHLSMSLLDFISWQLVSVWNEDDLNILIAEIYKNECDTIGGNNHAHLSLSSVALCALYGNASSHCFFRSANSWALLRMSFFLFSVGLSSSPANKSTSGLLHNGIWIVG